MAFYDFLLGPQRQIAANIKRVADRNSQAEDRDGAARWLAQNGSEEALYGMFSRFDLQIEHSLKDRNEKELVFELLLDHGAKVLPIARKFGEKSTNFVYAARLVGRISGEEAATTLLLELLEQETLENELKPEKKRLLLIALAERQDPRIVAAASRFLADFDEGVRAGAVEAIVSKEGDERRPLLLAALCNRKEESTRIRGRIAEAFAKKKWLIDTDDPWLPNHVPSGYRLVDGLLISAR